MSKPQKSTRFHERLHLKIPVEVHYQENADKKWTEQTMTEQATICGVGFSLSHPVEPKRLLRLKLPMPKNLRLFDYGKEFYEVWGIVRYVKLLETDEPDKIRVMVGAALTGSSPPKSFADKPNTLYDIKPFLREKSFWDSRELPRQSGRFMRSMEDRREVGMNLILETIYGNGEIYEAVEAETVNLSESGAALVTKLSSDYPNYVLVKTKDRTTSLLAAVRGVHELDGSNLRLHLEFISGKWQF
jgi:hypothetical protein